MVNGTEPTTLVARVSVITDAAGPEYDFPFLSSMVIRRTLLSAWAWPVSEESRRWPELRDEAWRPTAKTKTSANDLAGDGKDAAGLGIAGGGEEAT